MSSKNNILLNDWQLLSVSQFADVVTGGTPKTSVMEYWENGNVPWLPSGDLKFNRIKNAHRFITEYGLKNSSAKLMPVNTVLIAMTGATLGRVGLLDFEASANQSVTGILPNSHSVPEFLFYRTNRWKNTHEIW